jgi:hypothetical protein
VLSIAILVVLMVVSLVAIAVVSNLAGLYDVTIWIDLGWLCIIALQLFAICIPLIFIKVISKDQAKQLISSRIQRKIKKLEQKLQQYI